eukprot:TRINITY_DN121267_c0_g1_i1.p1 TRINITY_DN121267_c0_g1~~TRINITY_DN121267_c0_g1_i1.p1  ORF type:complete len:490 (-),score=95.76 TRINITY_DN121267_c0_g1_i1:160-1629(-)
MTGNIPYIGSKISLITTSDIRYEGILYTLNREESTIAVQNVRSYGTEGRRCPETPMSNEIYDFIIFRGKDLKDLTVLQGAPEQRPQSNYPSSPSDYGQDSTGYSSASQLGQASYAGKPQGYPAAGQDLYRGQSLGSTAQAAGRNSAYAAPMSSGMAGIPSVPASNPYASSASTAASYAGSAVAASGRGADKMSASPPYSSSSAAAATALGHARSAFADSSQDHLLSSAAAAAQQHQQVGRGGNVYDDNGLDFGRSPSEEAKAAAQRGAMPGDKARLADPKAANDAKARGRGKAGAQKRQLPDVLRFHKRAEESITKAMRSQNSANLSPSELRNMSESNPAVYHFYLDFVNYCCPPHMAQSDEQQWEMLCKALKKHFEKDFGAAAAQKPPQPQRPNNTLGDFITVQTDSKASKKAAGKVAHKPAPVRATKGGKKDGPNEADGPEDHDPSSGSSWACPRCTLRNENLLLECAACGTSKQQAALWAEFPPLG